MCVLLSGKVRKDPPTSRNVSNKIVKTIITYVSVQKIETEEDSK